MALHNSGIGVWIHNHSRFALAVMYPSANLPRCVMPFRSQAHVFSLQYSVVKLAIAIGEYIQTYSRLACIGIHEERHIHRPKPQIQFVTKHISKARKKIDRYFHTSTQFCLRYDDGVKMDRTLHQQYAAWLTRREHCWRCCYIIVEWFTAFNCNEVKCALFHKCIINILLGTVQRAKCSPFHHTEAQWENLIFTLSD